MEEFAPPAKEAEVELGKEVDGEKEVEEGAGKVEPGKLVVLPTREAAA